MTRALALGFLVFASCSWHHRFDEPEKWAKEFDDPARDAWQKPDEVISALELKSDARIADLGSGTGYFAVRLARVVPGGWVYALDVEPAMTQYLEDRAAKEDLTNLLALTTPEDSVALPERVDCLLIVNTYHHIEDRTEYFKKARPLLADTAKLVIIDFNQQSAIGPPKEHRLPPAQVEAELKAAGFTLAEHPELLPNQYFLVFTPTPAAAGQSR